LPQFFEATEPGAYSAFEVDGLPSLDASGQPLSKSQLKKLRKQLDKHARAFAKHRSSGSSGGGEPTSDTSPS
jgi:hypothetical protein